MTYSRNCEKEQRAKRRKVIELISGRILGQVFYYLLMRKLGAPRYMAYFAATANAQLVELHDPITPQVRKVFDAYNQDL